jgi:hypothetical protein
MSALGQKQTCAPQNAMSALPPIATVKADFRKRVQAPQGQPWFWTITAREYLPTTHSRGYSATREEAMMDFKAEFTFHAGGFCERKTSDSSVRYSIRR